MKATGTILAIGGVFCLFYMAAQDAAGPSDPTVTRDLQQQPNLVIPLIICAAAVCVGVFLALFGGRGYVVARDPRMHN